MPSLQHPSLRHLGHRPTPLPRRPWLLAMRWLDLAFLHWPVAPDALRPLLPAGLELDLFDGRAWLGVVPFCMAGVRLRGLPALPGAGSFPELNVRTYVRHGDLRGVWFFSLDAASRLAVRAARVTFGLPYFDAAMRSRRDGAAVEYESDRRHRGAPPAAFRARWRTTSRAVRPEDGSLPHWLVERYALFAGGQGRPLRAGHVHHEPWRLAPAEVQLGRCEMTGLLGMPLQGPPPLVHAAEPLAVIAWAPQRLPPTPRGG